LSSKDHKLFLADAEARDRENVTVEFEFSPQQLNRDGVSAEDTADFLLARARIFVVDTVQKYMDRDNRQLAATRQR
jgi:hypothetical protein